MNPLTQAYLSSQIWAPDKSWTARNAQRREIRFNICMRLIAEELGKPVITDEELEVRKNLDEAGKKLFSEETKDD